MAKKRACCRGLVFLIVVLAGWNVSSSQAASFFVSTDGDDANPGSQAKPFATLGRGRDAVRKFKGGGLVEPVDVILRGGVYSLDRTLQLTAEDGGDDQHPITWRAADGERALICGGRRIIGWKPWRNGIFVADLKSQGLDGIEFHQLFYKLGGEQDEFARRQVLARYPKFDPKHPRTGGFICTPSQASNPREQLRYAPGAFPWDKWNDISQAEVVATYNRGWMFAITPIQRVDTQTRTITVRQVRGEFLKLNRFFVQNVLDALDAPGEWYLDRKQSLLYFYPPEGDLNLGEVLAPILDDLVDVRGSIPYSFDYLDTSFHGGKESSPPPHGGALRPVTNLVFSRLDFDVAEQDGLRLVGASGCKVIGCRVSNIGGIGINLGGVGDKFEETGNPRRTPATGVAVGGAFGGGQILYFNDPCMNCRVAGCDVWATGMEGIMLLGENDVAQNDHVWDIGLYAKDAPCISLMGASNIARQNTLHDCPRCAIFLKGVDTLVELNDCHHTCLETCDMGAIRMVQRNLRLRGNKIRYNRVLDTIGYGYPFAQATPYQSPYYTWGIYLDDFTAGTEVTGNIISGTFQGGVMIHGGGDNLIANNLIVNAGHFQIQFQPITEGEGLRAYAGNRVERNIFVCIKKDSCGYLFTNPLRNTPEMPVLRNNLFWFGGQAAQFMTPGRKKIEGMNAWIAWSGEQNSLMADPKLMDPEKDDYRLAPDSPASKIGFQPIPMDQIGCYSGPERRSWPLTPNWDRFRETPVLYGR